MKVSVASSDRRFPIPPLEIRKKSDHARRERGTREPPESEPRNRRPRERSEKRRKAEGGTSTASGVPE